MGRLGTGRHTDKLPHGKDEPQDVGQGCAIRSGSSGARPIGPWTAQEDLPHGQDVP